MQVPVFLYAVTVLKCFTLKELFQEKNGLTMSLLFFFFPKMPKIGVGWRTLNRKKKRMALQQKNLQKN